MTRAGGGPRPSERDPTVNMTNPTTSRAALATCMSDVSEEEWSANWHAGLEWVLWQALEQWKAADADGDPHWRPAWPLPFGVTHFVPQLAKLHEAAGGWTWWLDNPLDGEPGPQWVPTERWRRLVAANTEHPDLDNDDLDKLVLGDALSDEQARIADKVEREMKASGPWPLADVVRLAGAPEDRVKPVLEWMLAHQFMHITTRAYGEREVVFYHAGRAPTWARVKRSG